MCSTLTESQVSSLLTSNEFPPGPQGRRSALSLAASDCLSQEEQGLCENCNHIGSSHGRAGPSQPGASSLLMAVSVAALTPVGLYQLC